MLLDERFHFAWFNLNPKDMMGQQNNDSHTVLEMTMAATTAVVVSDDAKTLTAIY